MRSGDGKRLARSFNLQGMSITKADFQEAVDCVFEEFADFIVRDSNIVLPAKNYDPATGAPTGSETLYPISEIIFVDYELSRIDGQIIRRLDKQALFRISEISVEVTDKMILRLASGEEWDIVEAVRDPADALYELQCRRP